MTSFQDIDLIVTEIAALFTAEGSWQDVYDYFPGLSTFQGRSPVLVVIDNGTLQEFDNLHTNPTTYNILLASYVLVNSDSDATITSEAATTQRRALNVIIRQTIRDNAGGGTYYDLIQFTPRSSQIERLNAEGLTYELEMFEVAAFLKSGSKP